MKCETTTVVDIISTYLIKTKFKNERPCCPIVIFNSQFVKISTLFLCNASYGHRIMNLLTWIPDLCFNAKQLQFMVKLFICCGSIVMKLCTVNGTAWINHIKHHIPPSPPPKPPQHNPLIPRLDSLLYLSIKKETHYQWFNQRLMSWFYWVTPRMQGPYPLHALPDQFLVRVSCSVFRSFSVGRKYCFQKKME